MSGRARGIWFFAELLDDRYGGGTDRWLELAEGIVDVIQAVGDVDTPVDPPTLEEGE